jgi:hypothetical protein
LPITYLYHGVSFLRNIASATDVSDKTVATPSKKGVVNQVAVSTDTSLPASGATPSKTEFDTLLGELRDLKTKMRAAGILAT